jgi:hypothetical protein
MIEDKYIGLALAVSGSVAIGTSFIITKKVPSLTEVSFEPFPSCLSGTKRCGREEFRLRKCERPLRLPQKSNLVGRNGDK